MDIDGLVKRLKQGHERGKKHSIIIVAEGVMSGGELAKMLKDRAEIETRVSVLGHIQRGGSPTARDRVFASRLGAKAVETLLENRGGVAIGIHNREVVDYKLKETFNKEHKAELSMYTLSKELSI